MAAAAGAVPKGAIDQAVAIPTLVGSLLSSLGAGFIVATYILLPPKPSHIRHTLILNLAIADLVNAASGSIGGIAIQARHRDLVDGPACVTNGFFIQLSVQAVDCSILLISFTVFYLITRSDSIHSKRSFFRTLPLVIAPWILPLITASIALAKNYYHPVSGNWCWIQPRPKYLRYVLTHGWRFMIFIAVVVMGVYTRYYVKTGMAKHRRNLEHTATPSEMKHVRDDPDKGEPLSEALDLQDSHESHESELASSEVRKVLLLSSYPVYYIILWIPGIANRLAEATGHGARWLRILQASTQFVGLANAVTFGWNEVRDRFSMQQLLEMLLGFVLGS